MEARGFAATAHATAAAVILTGECSVVSDCPSQGGAQTSLDCRKAAAVRRKGRPRRVCLFSSPESNYISGQVIVCGGGLIF